MRCSGAHQTFIAHWGASMQSHHLQSSGRPIHWCPTTYQRNRVSKSTVILSVCVKVLNTSRMACLSTKKRRLGHFISARRFEGTFHRDLDRGERGWQTEGLTESIYLRADAKPLQTHAGINGPVGHSLGASLTARLQMRRSVGETGYPGAPGVSYLMRIAVGFTVDRFVRWHFR